MYYCNNEMGFITVITGPMFSEKSGELIDMCLKPQLYGKKTFIAYKPNIDTRWDCKKITSRVGKSIPAEGIPCNLTDEIVHAILLACEPYDIVAFDEAQFFNENIVTLANTLAFNKKHVIIDCLNMTFKGTEFGNVGSLLAIADEVVRLYAYCSCCGSPMASFSQMLIKGRPAVEASEVTIEGNANNITYEPRCRNCFVPPSMAE